MKDTVNIECGPCAHMYAALEEMFISRSCKRRTLRRSNSKYTRETRHSKMKLLISALIFINNNASFSLSHSLPPSKNMFSQHFSLLISPLSHPRLPPSSNVRCKTTTANVNLYSLLAAVLSSCYQRSQTTSSTLDGFFNFLRKASEKK